MFQAPFRSRERRTPGLLPLAWVVLVLLGAGCGSGTSSPSGLPDPVFTDPLVKLQETGDRMGFSETLFAQ